MVWMSVLITGGTTESRLLAAEKRIGSASSGVDVVVMEPGSGIAAAREIKAALSRKPYQSKLISVIIPEAETLTEEAQNALLKTLEEPPGGAELLLLTAQPEALLPTVRSRCQIVDLGRAAVAIELAELKAAYNLWVSGSLNRLFEAASEARPEVWTELFRQILLYQLGGQALLEKLTGQARLTEFLDAKKLDGLAATQTDRSLINFLKLAQVTKDYLDHNVNRRLALENLFLNLPTPKTQS